jgi:hypothetical protein
LGLRRAGTLRAKAAASGKFEVLARVLDAWTRRLVASAEARTIGFDGVTVRGVLHQSGYCML